MVNIPEVPAGIEPIPEGAEMWSREYQDGVHVIFDAEAPPRRWRFGPEGFRLFVEYARKTDKKTGKPYSTPVRWIPATKANAA